MEGTAVRRNSSWASVPAWAWSHTCGLVVVASWLVEGSMPPVVVAVGDAAVGLDEVGVEYVRAPRAGLSCAFQR